MIKWDRSLTVKVDIFDMQHKELINIINSFYLAIESNSSKEKLLETIEALKDYTIVHFSTEERYMIKNEYSNYEMHKLEHDHFIEKINNFEERFKSGKLLLSLEVSSFLKEWLINHILGTDKRLGEVLSQKGIH